MFHMRADLCLPLKIIESTGLFDMEDFYRIQEFERVV